MAAAKVVRVGFNARVLSDSHLRGFNRHTVGLLNSLRVLAPDWEFHLFTDRPLAANHIQALNGCPIHFCKIRPHILWEQIAFPLSALAHGITILHSPINLGIPGPFFGSLKRVVTVHDLFTVQDFSLPAPNRGPLDQLSFNISWKTCLSADAVIAVSHYSRGQILQAYPRLAEKVTAIHNGVETCFTAGPADHGVLARHRLDLPYAIHVGGFEERKNVALIAEGFRALPEGSRGKIILALVGESSSISPRLREALDSLPQVRWLGHVSDNDLVALYRGALCAIVPSREEGFGFPVIEAMACGCPVLSSNATSLPEVGGEAAAYFGPDDPRALASHLERLLKDQAWAKALGKAGLARRQHFSWDKAAAGTLEIYRKLLTI